MSVAGIEEGEPQLSVLGDSERDKARSQANCHSKVRIRKGIKHKVKSIKSPYPCLWTPISCQPVILLAVITSLHYQSILVPWRQLPVRQHVLVMVVHHGIWRSLLVMHHRRIAINRLPMRSAHLIRIWHWLIVHLFL